MEKLISTVDKYYIDKHNNLYYITNNINHESIKKHIQHMLDDTPHDNVYELKSIIAIVLSAINNCIFLFYKNNKLVSFSYGILNNNIYDIKLYWYNTMKNSFIFFSLLVDILTTINIIHIDRPFKTSKWYLFSSFFNTRITSNNIHIIDNAISKSKLLLNKYEIKLWDNTEQLT